MRIGIDLDNTIIHYDDAFIVAAQKRGLIAKNFTGTKQQVRDHIRTLPDGETEWQKLQGHVYGAGIGDAKIYPGAEEFLTRAQGHELFIVSHKTEFGHYDPEMINLRNAATNFLENHGFFTTLGFKRGNISYHSTRAEKVSKIAALGLDAFIDDLVEVYEEPHFPVGTRKILFHTSENPAPTGHFEICNHWHEITKTLLS